MAATLAAASRPPCRSLAHHDACMVAARSRATIRTSITSMVVNGAPTPALSYCQMPVPGCQNARLYGVDGSRKA